MSGGAAVGAASGVAAGSPGAAGIPSPVRPATAEPGASRTRSTSSGGRAGSAAAGMSRPEFLAIVGCTGAGKTALSLHVARELGAEIVSMDSRQVYRGMDIGTAKATAHERALVPHHGLDIRDPGERYSAGEFGRDARRWIRAIRARGRVPLLVGGTGFFLRVLTDPIFREPPLDGERRAALERVLAALPRGELERWVRVLDPERAAALSGMGGCRRMLRTLIVTLLTGKKLSWWHVRHPTDAKALHGMVCRLRLPPDLLGERIDRRVRRMIEAGLRDEVAGLLAAGHAPDHAGMDGVGYREMAEHLAGRITLDEAARRTRRATRRYAKRQRTWFRHQLGPDVVEVDGTTPLAAQAEVVAGAWRERCGAGRPGQVAPGAGEAPAPGTSAGTGAAP